MTECERSVTLYSLQHLDLKAAVSYDLILLLLYWRYKGDPKKRERYRITGWWDSQIKYSDTIKE